MTYCTSYLYANPTFLSGMAATLDMSGSLEVYNSSQHPAQADRVALMNDWYVTGSDVRLAMDVYETEQEA